MKRGTDHRQSGLSLLEMLLAVGGFGLLSIGIADQIRLYNENAQASTIAGEVEMIATAGERYIRDNYTAGADLLSQVSPGSPVTVPVDEMSGYLPSGFDARIGRDKTACLMVGQSGPDENLEGVVVTTGGIAYNDSLVSKVSNELGAIGGAVYNDQANFGAGIQGRSFSLTGGDLGALGFSGSGACPTGTGVSAGAVALQGGHPAAFLEVRPDRFDAGVLYRNQIAGRPELNEMNTDLDMGANDINNAENVNVNDQLVVGGNAAVGDNIAALNNIGTREGNVIAQNANDDPGAGNFIGDNAIFRDTEIGGAPVRANNGIYYADVINSGQTVPAPTCNKGTPQIHGGIASALLRDDTPQANAIPYVAAYIQVTPDDPDPAKVTSWDVTLYLMDYGGIWQLSDSGFSRLSMFAKCSGA